MKKNGKLEKIVRGEVEERDTAYKAVGIDQHAWGDALGTFVASTAHFGNGAPSISLTVTTRDQHGESETKVNFKVNQASSIIAGLVCSLMLIDPQLAEKAIGSAKQETARIKAGLEVDRLKESLGQKALE